MHEGDVWDGQRTDPLSELSVSKSGRAQTGPSPRPPWVRPEWKGKDPRNYPFEETTTSAPRLRGILPPRNGVAQLDVVKPGVGMATGQITINRRTYRFTSGAPNKLSIPPGEKLVAHYRDRTGTRGMTVGSGKDKIGYSFDLLDPNTREDKTPDPRAQKGKDHAAGERTYLRIHPDGGSPGTSGCIGIVGGPDTQRQFVADMTAELKRKPNFVLRIQGPILPDSELRPRRGVDPLPSDPAVS